MTVRGVAGAVVRGAPLGAGVPGGTGLALVDVGVAGDVVVVGGGVADGVAGAVDVGVGGAQIGSTELRDSSSIWLMASSSDPDGRPAITWARSEGRMSLTARRRQPRSPWACPALIRESSSRAFKQPRR